MTFKEQIESYLSALPSKWKAQLTEVLCEIYESRQTPTCEDVKKCETLTTLSDFSVTDGQVCITYKDEKGVSFQRCFTVDSILNGQLDDIQPGCLTDETTWSNLSFAERIQLLIDAHCDCCQVLPS